MEYFFLRFGDEKNETHFLKKATFTEHSISSIPHKERPKDGNSLNDGGNIMENKGG